MPTERSVMKSNENRRSNKPIMEKRRRARINSCLNELKALILEALKKDPARHSKLEKADILEMTVKHLQNLQRQQVALQAVSNPSVTNKFRAGYHECTNEVSRYLRQMDGVDSSVQHRLLNHLSACVQFLNRNESNSNLLPQAAAAPQQQPLNVRVMDAAGQLTPLATPTGADKSSLGFHLLPNAMINAILLPNNPNALFISSRRMADSNRRLTAPVTDGHRVTPSVLLVDDTKMVRCTAVNEPSAVQLRDAHRLVGCKEPWRPW